jgi:hypothetical protein
MGKPRPIILVALVLCAVAVAAASFYFTFLADRGPEIPPEQRAKAMKAMEEFNKGPRGRTAAPKPAAKKKDPEAKGAE